MKNITLSSSKEKGAEIFEKKDSSLSSLPTESIKNNISQRVSGVLEKSSVPPEEKLKRFGSLKKNNISSAPLSHSEKVSMDFPEKKEKEYNDKDTSLYAPFRFLKKVIESPRYAIEKGIMGRRRRAMESRTFLDESGTEGVSSLAVTQGIRDIGIHEGAETAALLESWKNQNPDKQILSVGDSQDAGKTMTIYWKVSPGANAASYDYEKYHYPIRIANRKNEYAVWRGVKFALATPIYIFNRMLGPNKILLQSKSVSLEGGKKQDSLQVTGSLSDTMLRNGGYLVNEAISNWKREHPQAKIDKITTNDQGVWAKKVNIVYTESEPTQPLETMPGENINQSSEGMTNYKKMEVQKTEKNKIFYAPVRFAIKALSTPFLLVFKGLGGRRRILEQTVSLGNGTHLTSLDINEGIRDIDLNTGAFSQAALESWKNENPDKEIISLGDSSDIDTTVTILWRPKPGANAPEDSFKGYHFPIKESDSANLNFLGKSLTVLAYGPAQLFNRIIGRNKTTLYSRPMVINEKEGLKKVSIQATQSFSEFSFKNKAYFINRIVKEFQDKHPNAKITHVETGQFLEESLDSNDDYPSSREIIPRSTINITYK